MAWFAGLGGNAPAAKLCDAPRQRHPHQDGRAEEEHGEARHHKPQRHDAPLNDLDHGLYNKFQPRKARRACRRRYLE